MSSAKLLKPNPRAAGAELRQLRNALALSQRAFATRLGVPLETYRAWESGRRVAPNHVITRAAACARLNQDGVPMALADLAVVLAVSEMTLRNAARSGRLRIVTAAPAILGKPILRAMRGDGEAFLTNHYRRAPRRNSRRNRLQGLPPVTIDCAERVRKLREALRLSQRLFADRVGARGRAVVYQWESGKRRPSPVLWSRLVALGA